MRVHALVSILACVLLISCRTAPTPASTPAAGNLAHLDLEQLAFQPDDFPPNTFADTRFTEVQLGSPLNPNPKIATQYLRGIDKTNGAARGLIYLIVYWDPTDAHARYDSDIQYLNMTDLTEYPYYPITLGEYAFIQPIRQSTRLAFGRCHAYVYITLDIPQKTMLTYAQRLDTRLKAAVCSEATPLLTPTRP